MNRDLLNQLPADEQPAASKLDSVAADMKISPDFQWDLESQLMDEYKTRARSAPGWQLKILPALGWAIVAIGAIVLMNWTLRSPTPEMPPAAPSTSTPEPSFEASIRQGNICSGTIALVHGFSAFLTNEEKTSFVPLDTADTIGEVRSFAWSADGKRLAIIGNTTGGGTIYITEPARGQIEYILSGSGTGYLWDAAWSRDGRQFVIWAPQNNTVYLLNANGSGLVEKKLGVQVLGKPQFAPDGRSIFFYGADSTTTGLFTVSIEGSQPTLVIPYVEGESSWAFSLDGSLLAYIEYDRDKGEARLSTRKLIVGEHSLLGTLSIPRTSGAALPEAANLSWSPDGSFLVFDLGYFASQRAIYMAHADGSELTQMIELGYAPTISPDGRCLAYISGKQVFLLDLADPASMPVLLADLPAGRTVADIKLDKLQWRP